MIKWTDLDDAILGTVERCGMERVFCYSHSKAVEIFMEQGMSYEEAIEWIDFNVLGAYVGEHTPVFLFEDEETYYD